MPRHVYGITPTNDQVQAAIAKARKVYEDVPPTVCQQRTCCCKAGCPNMYYAEFLSLYEGAILGIPPEEYLDIIMKCVRMYLFGQDKPKPCVFLDGVSCSAYQYRPLKCRLYGLIPENLFNRVAESVARENKKPRREVALCVQCPFVKASTENSAGLQDGKIPEKKIMEMEQRLRDCDRMVGITRFLQQTQYAYLTFHDWLLLFEFGEEYLEKLTPLRLKLSEPEKEQFLEALKQAYEAKTGSQ
jgi:Fe-S-cluster containining protein